MDFCGRVLPLTETDKDLDGIFFVLNRTTADFGAKFLAGLSAPALPKGGVVGARARP